MEIITTDNKNADFEELRILLDKDLGERYGDLQKEYDKHNKVDYIKDVIIIYKDKVPVACGAFKEYDSKTAEIKRVFVRKEYRNQGISKLILHKLEELIREQGYEYAVLETGIKQQEAMSLYKKIGYELIENYGPYIGKPYSVCMKKVI